jgi:hypothetical protein
MLEKLATEMHSSLLQKFLNYGREKFYNIDPDCKHLAFLVQIWLACKILQGTNTLAYCALPSNA